MVWVWLSCVWVCSVGMWVGGCMDMDVSVAVGVGVGRGISEEL